MLRCSKTVYKLHSSDYPAWKIIIQYPYQTYRHGAERSRLLPPQKSARSTRWSKKVSCGLGSPTKWLDPQVFLVNKQLFSTKIAQIRPSRAAGNLFRKKSWSDESHCGSIKSAPLRSGAERSAPLPEQIAEPLTKLRGLLHTPILNFMLHSSKRTKYPFQFYYYSSIFHFFLLFLQKNKLFNRFTLFYQSVPNDNILKIAQNMTFMFDKERIL